MSIAQFQWLVTHPYFLPLLARNKELRRHVYELQPDNNDLNHCQKLVAFKRAPRNVESNYNYLLRKQFCYYKIK